jgi:hypothetical protein
MGGVPYKKRLMVTKSIRISEELLKRVEAQLWNEALESIPHGRQVEFYARAVVNELERLEGKNIDAALTELNHVYVDLASCSKVSSKELTAIEVALAVLRDVKQTKEREESATI